MGDYADGEDCKFCESSYPQTSLLGDEITIKDACLIIKIFNLLGWNTRCKFEINYCPHCGRRLR